MIKHCLNVNLPLGNVRHMPSSTKTEPIATEPTRRERLRAELTEQIIEIGRRQLEEGGVANVNWRAIAHEVGMNPASLYTYVQGIHDLYTRILGHSFASLGDAVAQAARKHADASGRERLLVCARAYRTWAVERPNQFNLIFTDQIPGYEAPTEGEAFDAAMNVNAPFVQALDDVFAEANVGAPTTPSRGRTRDKNNVGYEFRSMMHGFTILEINQHSPYVEGSDEMMVDALTRLLDSINQSD